MSRLDTMVIVNADQSAFWSGDAWVQEYPDAVMYGHDSEDEYETEEEYEEYLDGQEEEARKELLNAGPGSILMAGYGYTDRVITRAR